MGSSEISPSSLQTGVSVDRLMFDCMFYHSGMPFLVSGGASLDQIIPFNPLCCPPHGSFLKSKLAEMISTFSSVILLDYFRFLWLPSGVMAGAWGGCLQRSHPCRLPRTSVRINCAHSIFSFSMTRLEPLGAVPK